MITPEERAALLRELHAGGSTLGAANEPNPLDRTFHAALLWESLERHIAEKLDKLTDWGATS